jgi:hypothetical protein
MNKEIFLLRKNQPDNCPQWIEGIGDCHKKECNFCEIEKKIEKLENNGYIQTN